MLLNTPPPEYVSSLGLSPSVINTETVTITIQDHEQIVFTGDIIFQILPHPYDNVPARTECKAEKPIGFEFSPGLLSLPPYIPFYSLLPRIILPLIYHPTWSPCTIFHVVMRSYC